MRNLKTLILSVIVLTSAKTMFGQIDKLNKMDLHPVSPTAFQFLKYTEMPVTEYTGLPNISVPIYQFSEDGVNVPIALNYHAVGNRVSQESSWVGLGWDLTIGSIVQHINDRDDYGIDDLFQVENIRLLPDFYSTGGIPSEFPIRYKYPCIGGSNGNGSNWSHPVSVNSPTRAMGFKIATDYWIPVNGQFNVQQTDLFTQRRYDSEPDIFIANFFGHTIRFIRQGPPIDQLVVLNKKGYKISRINGNFKVIVPSGDEFYFEEKSQIESYSTSEDITGFGGGNYEHTSNVWLITKIITKNKKEITFRYTRTATNEGFQQYSDKLQLRFLQNTYQHAATPTLICDEDYYRAYPESNTYQTSGYYKSYSRTREQYVYLDSITFPKGTIKFTLSSRNDITGGLKLDKVSVKAGFREIKSVNFNYGYFDATAVGGNGYPMPAGAPLPSVASYRLKLLSLQDNSGAIHAFTYNATALPNKNSFAQDFWGFYNGQLTNTSLVPNPTFLNYPILGTNSNNRGARLTYAKACILEQVQYPTGGRAVFDYELNQFDNYWLPDYGSNTNTVTSGNGLRIKSITHYASGNDQSKKIEYTYTGGKDILPRQVYRSLVYSELKPNPSFGIIGEQKMYNIHELNINGVYQSSPLSSVNGVGYSMVTRKEVDAAGAALGRVETTFYNSPSYWNNNVSQVALHAAVPAIKEHAYPENGSPQFIEYFDQSNNKLKRVENQYTNVQSPIYYAARIFSYSNLWYEGCGGSPVPCTAVIFPLTRNLVAFYPIFDFETLRQKTIETEYANGEQLITTTDNSFEIDYNMLVTTSRSNSMSNSKLQYTYPFSSENSANAACQTMVDRNRLSEIVSIKTYVTDLDGWNERIRKWHTKTFTPVGDMILESKLSIIERLHPFDNKPVETFYDQYDNSGNLLQMTDNSIPISYIHDYNNQYVVAEIRNAPISSVAATSFEAGGLGGWTMNSGGRIFNEGSITGRKAFSGTLTKSVPAGNYVVTLWSLTSGTSTVNSVAGTVLITKGNYQLRQWKFTNVNSIQVTGDHIDEVRLYPQGAQISTYTYDPLVGITSECDLKNTITYYTYDEAGRLILVRDQDKNILKKYCYNYSGQTENCNIYYNTVQSGNFTRTTSCPAGSGPSQTTYQVPDGLYASSESLVKANALAMADVTANGQSYADAYGPCYPAFSGKNQTSVPWNVNVVSVGGGFNNTYTINVGSTFTPLAYLAPGTYNFTFTPVGSAGSVQLLFNSSGYNGTSFTVNNVTISGASNFTLQTPCTITISSGYFSPANSLNNNGTQVSFFMVLMPQGSSMTSPNTYHVATINGNCRPSVDRTHGFSENGRVWSITIQQDGMVKWKLLTGSPVTSGTTVVCPSFNYDL